MYSTEGSFDLVWCDLCGGAINVAALDKHTAFHADLETAVLQFAERDMDRDTELVQLREELQRAQTASNHLDIECDAARRLALAYLVHRYAGGIDEDTEYAELIAAEQLYRRVFKLPEQGPVQP